MKKLMMLFFALMLCMPVFAEDAVMIPAALTAPANGYIALETAITNALAALPEKPEKHQTRAELVIMSDNYSRRWIVTVFDMTSLSDAWSIELDAFSGEVKASYTTCDGFFQDVLEKWTAQKGPQVLWTPPEKMLFDSLYALQPSYGKSLDSDISWGDAATRAATALGIIKGKYDIGYGYLMGGEGYNGVWEICFVDDGALVYKAHVDAVTGEILLIESDEGGNG